MARTGLVFTTIVCLRCEAERQARFACPECGLAPAATETDIHVQDRQRALARIGDRSALVQRLDLNVLGLWDLSDLAEIAPRMFEAWKGLARDPSGGVDAFRDVAAEVATLELWAAEIEPLRPLVVLTRHTQAVIKSLVDIYDLLAASLGEEQMKKAQAAANRLQGLVDAVGAELRRVRELVDRVDRVLDEPDPIAAWIGESAVAGDLEATVASGQALVEARLGRQVEAGAAFVAGIHHTVMSTLGDPDEFWRLAGDHLVRLERAAPQTLEVVDEPLFSARLAEVTEDLWDGARRAAVTPEPASLRTAARDILEAGHLVTEQALKLHLGVLCAATSRNSFSDTQAGDVSALLDVAVGKRWAVAAALGDSSMRNAFAHRDFAVVGDEVSLSPRRRQQDGEPEVLMGLDAMQDSVLRFVEAGAAMDLAIGIFLESHGVTVETAPLERVLSVALLSALGWSEVTVDHQDERVFVSAVVTTDVDESVLGFAAHPFLDTAHALELRLVREDTGQSCVVEIDLRRGRDFRSAEDERQKHAAFVLHRHSTLIDGEPMWSPAQVERYAARLGWEAIIDPDISTPDLRKVVRVLRHLAQEAGLDAVDRELAKCMRLRLQAGGGWELDPADFEDLAAMAEKVVPEIRHRIL